MKSPKLINIKTQIIFSILILSILSSVFSQDITPLEVGKIVQGSMLLDESHKYYSLKITKSEAGKVLIVTTHEDSSISKDLKDSFSDPDFYISKKNKYPSSKRSSEWRSEQYGSDILSIPSESVEEDDIFYIGLYCQFKCKYFLKVETGIETEVKLKEYNYIRLKPKESMNYKIKIKNDFEKLKVMAYSTNGAKFKIFMNQNSPSSANTYKVIPSWESGYVIIIKKDSKEYCNNCEYHVIIYNESNEEADEINPIIFYVEIEEKDNKYNLEPFVKFYDVIEDNSKSCFTFNITKREKEEEKLILDIVVYSGYATLFIEGWRSKNYNNLEQVDKNPNSDKIFLEKYIILSKVDFDKFDQEDSYYNGRDSVLHFCLYSSKQISYTITAYYLASLNKVTQNNALMQGFLLKGYLLKDQVISYELFVDNINKMKNNIETNMTITISKIVGSISSYVYFCDEEECKLNTKYDIENLKDKNKLLTTKQELNPFISTLNIPYNDNYCMKNPIVTLNNGNKINCNTYAIIACDKPSDDNDLCIYDIQFKLDDTEIVMKQKKIYYGILHMGKTDKYRITISDSNIETIFIVLNSEMGDAQLSVYLEDETSYRKESLISISSHNDYIPDVVKINKQKIGKENLVGKYIVKIYPETFSSYQVYYYVIYKKDSYSYYISNKYKSPEVTMNLNLGFVLADYFPNDIRYKIYSYMPLNNKENIKVFINRININYDIYIFTDISKFEIEQLSSLTINPRKEPISGYQYKSNSNNEVIIPKNASNLIYNKIIYIVVAPTNPLLLRDNMNENTNEQLSKEELDKKAVSKYYIGISSENVPLSLSEEILHTMTLSNSYSYQTYQKLYPTNGNKVFTITLSMLMGQIDIFVSTKFLKEEDIANIDFKNAKYNALSETYSIDNIIFKLNIQYITVLEINNEFIKESSNYPNDNKYIYYYIKRSESMIKEDKSCQYILIEKTSETRGHILQPGIVLSGKIEVGKKAYYIVEEIEKRKWAFINVIFKKGSGNLYLRIPNIPEPRNRIRFPNEGNFDYKGRFIYSGRIIEVPEKEFKKLDPKNNKLQLLITITAETGSEVVISSDDTNNNQVKQEIEYSISYSNEPKRINQNEPYDGYISQGEFQYFILYFDKMTENIYIGLTNMNGDADMYLNKGEELPTINKYDFSSTENGHEYIDIGKDDIFFKDKNKTISGYYSLLIVGFIDTSFSLFVSSHEKKVFPLRNNIPMTCWCENKGEKCFFRYNHVYDKNNELNGIDHNEIIFTSQYLYGSGFMYSKILVDSELHTSKNFYKSFPDSSNYDYSNKESNQPNYMKIKVKGEKYTKDTSVLLTFECNQKTKVDITSTSLNHFSTVDFIRDKQENIYYLGINDVTQQLSKITLIYNNNVGKDQDLIYSVHSYIGDAHFKVYGNSSNWDVNSQKIVYDYKLLNEFDLITNDNNQDYNIEVYNPYTHDYHNFISKSDKEKYDDIYFYVEPKTEFGFYIQCYFDKNWNKLQIGKSQSFYVINQELFGYFDIIEEYNNIEFSLSVNKNLRMFAELYIKINIIDKNEITQIKKNPQKPNDEFSLYHYSIPTQDNYDYKSITDKTLGTLSINLNKLPRLTEEDLEKGNKIIRALFYVRLENLAFTPLQEVTTSDSTGNNEENLENEAQNEQFDTSSNMVNIALIPGINNFKYMDLKQYEYYFSNLTYPIGSSLAKPIETKVYSLTRENPEHDIMVIEISTCKGYYTFNIQEEMITSDNIMQNSIKYTETEEKGKKIILIENLKSKHYYLSIRPQGSLFFCRINNFSEKNCGTNLEYLIYYYTAYSDNLSFLDIDKWITHRPIGKGRVRLDLPLIITKDLDDNKKKIRDFKFDVYATKNQELTNKMENICYLSRLIPNKTTIFKLDSLSIEKEGLIISDLEPGNDYYINVLVQNTKTKELITFHPIKIFSGGRRPLRWWRFIRNILIICLLIILAYYIYKYRQAKDEIIFLKGEAQARTEREMSGFNTMGYDSQSVKYSTLGSGY